MHQSIIMAKLKSDNRDNKINKKYHFKETNKNNNDNDNQLNNGVIDKNHIYEYLIKKIGK